MPIYTFFRHGAHRTAPSFDVEICDREGALAHAADLLARNPQYVAIEILEGEELVALVRGERPEPRAGASRSQGPESSQGSQNA